MDQIVDDLTEGEKVIEQFLKNELVKFVPQKKYLA
jgi:hypothetical protein